MVIKRLYDEKIEEWYVLIYDNNEEVKSFKSFGQKSLAFFEGGKFAKTTFQHCDLKIIENYLLQIDSLKIE